MRLRFLKNIIVIFFIILAFSLWYIQCIQGPRYTELSRKNRIRLVSLPGPRGNIYDKSGSLLAGSRLAFNCAVIPQEFKTGEGKIERLSSILKIESDVLEERIRKNARYWLAVAVPCEVSYSRRHDMYCFWLSQLRYYKGWVY